MEMKIPLEVVWRSQGCLRVWHVKLLQHKASVHTSRLGTVLVLSSPPPCSHQSITTMTGCCYTVSIRLQVRVMSCYGARAHGARRDRTRYLKDAIAIMQLMRDIDA
jgi:hypothetical protein